TLWHGGNVRISVPANIESMRILGYGIKVKSAFVLADGIEVGYEVPKLDLKVAVKSAENNILHYAGFNIMSTQASFALVISVPGGGRDLAIKTWNSLWVFWLLSLACDVDCFSLYTVTETGADYGIANHEITLTFGRVRSGTERRLTWARAHFNTFNELIDEQKFSTALRYHGNAHHLRDIGARIMLLWAGIECLLGVQGEQRSRVSLYSAILCGGSPSLRFKKLTEVKKAYDRRSQVVHGGSVKHEEMEASAEFAAQLLRGLLRKCLELGRVPTPDEIDQTAVRGGNLRKARPTAIASSPSPRAPSA